MAENPGNSGTPILAFIVGALVVVVAIVAFFMYNGGMPGASESVNVNVKAPDISAPPAPGG